MLKVLIENIKARRVRHLRSWHRIRRPNASGTQTRTLLAHLHHSWCNHNFDGICSTTLESWCREGELNPQDPKVGGF